MSRVGFKTKSVKEDERKELLPVKTSAKIEALDETEAILHIRGFQAAMGVLSDYFYNRIQGEGFNTPRCIMEQKITVIKKRYFDPL